MSSSQLVLGLTTFVAGALLGFGASAWSSSPVPEAAAAIPARESPTLERAQSATSDASLLAELRQLTDAVRANTDALRESPRRETASPDAEALEQRLESLLESVLDRTVSHEAPSRRERVPAGEPTRGVHALAPLDPEIGFGEHNKALGHHHLLWSYEDVIEAYGKPDHMHADEQGVRWSYVMPETQGTRTYDFIFVDGLVVDVGGGL